MLQANDSVLTLGGTILNKSPQSNKNSKAFQTHTGVSSFQTFNESLKNGTKNSFKNENMSIAVDLKPQSLERHKNSEFD